MRCVRIPKTDGIMEQETPKTEFEKRLEEKAAAEAEAEGLAAAPEGAEDQAPEEVATSENPEEAGIDLAHELLERTAECNDLKDQLLRARAEFDNYRKRMARERERIRKTAAEELIVGLLPVVDNLERALEHTDEDSAGVTEGVELVVNQFRDVLHAQGVETIPAAGEAFDPKVHEALSHQPSEEYAADLVMQEFQRGYRIDDYIVRPAKVVVSSGPSEPAPEESPSAAEAEAVETDSGHDA